MRTRRLARELTVRMTRPAKQLHAVENDAFRSFFKHIIRVQLAARRTRDRSLTLSVLDSKYVYRRSVSHRFQQRLDLFLNTGWFNEQIAYCFSHALSPFVYGRNVQCFFCQCTFSHYTITSTALSYSAISGEYLRKKICIYV